MYPCGLFYPVFPQSSSALCTNPVLAYLSFFLMIFMLTLESRTQAGLLLFLGGVAIFLYLMI